MAMRQKQRLIGSTKESSSSSPMLPMTGGGSKFNYNHTNNNNYRTIVTTSIILLCVLAIIFTVSSTNQSYDTMFMLDRCSDNNKEPTDLSSSSSSSGNSNKMLLDLPKRTKSIIMNIGSNKDPIFPKKSQGPCAISIAFEPIVPHLVPSHHPQVHVVPAAVSNSKTGGIQTMYTYNADGVSSSLSQPMTDAYWNTGKNKGTTKFVPIIPMVDVLDSIPPHINIDLIMTDAQGYDFAMIQSAITKLRDRGVKYLMTEVYLDHITTYQNIQNDLCLHWIPMMEQNGYTFVRLENPKRGMKGYSSIQEAKVTCAAAAAAASSKSGTSSGDSSTSNLVAGIKENNAYWVLSSLGTIPADNDVFEYERLLPTTTPAFTKEEYDACNVA